MKPIIAVAGLALAGASSAIAQPAPPPPPVMQMPPMVRPMAPPTMTRTDVPGRIRQMFERLDTNRDGALTQQEIAARQGMRTMVMRRPEGAGAGAPGMSPLPPLSPMAPGAGFDAMDRDHNGVITRDEYAQVSAMGPRQVQVIRIRRAGDGDSMGKGMGHGGMGMGMNMRGQMFGMADANRDGRVTLPEATNAALQHFDMMDRNRDGRITPDEGQMMRGRMRPQRG